MQTIKGLAALAVVAAAVFVIGATDDLRSQAHYAAQLRDFAGSGATGQDAVAVAHSANVNLSKAGGVTANTVGKNRGTMTNVTDQAKRKSPRT